MILPVLALIVLSLLISLPLTWLLVRLGHRTGMLDSAGAAGHEKKSLRRVPNIGGVAIFWAIVAPMLAALAAVWMLPQDQWQHLLPALFNTGPEPGYLLERIRSTTPTALALIAALAGLHAMGLYDDRRSLGPAAKILVQVIAAAVLVIFFEVRLLTLLGDVPSVIVTILWLVAVTNAINFLDNMDGLAGGVAMIASALFMTAAILHQQWFIAATLALMIGSLGGFLAFNFPPAKIFMGDGGSLIIGFLLGVLTARTTYYNPADPAGELSSDLANQLGGGWYAVFMPLIVLAIPLYDLASVTIIRLLQGRSPLVGDQQHFSHRLVQRGLSRRGAVIVIWSLTAVTGISGIMLGSLQDWQALLVGAQTLLVLLVIALFEHASRRSGPRDGTSFTMQKDQCSHR